MTSNNAENPPSFTQGRANPVTPNRRYKRNHSYHTTSTSDHRSVVDVSRSGLLTVLSLLLPACESPPAASPDEFDIAKLLTETLEPKDATDSLNFVPIRCSDD